MASGLAVEHDQIVSLVGAPNLTNVTIDVEAALGRVIETHRVDLKDIALTGQQLLQLLTPFPQLRGRRIISSLRMERVTVTGPCDLSEVQVMSNLHVQECVFAGDLNLSEAGVWCQATFDQVSFGGDLNLEMAKFRADVDITRCLFSGALNATSTVFDGNLNFLRIERPGRRRTRKGGEFGTFEEWRPAEGVLGCVFERDVKFPSSNIKGVLQFSQNVFSSDVDFSGATLHQGGSWAKSSFGGVSAFTGTHFVGEANFASAEFTLEDVPTGKRDFWNRSPVSFHGAQFDDEFSFSCTLAGHVSFIRATCASSAAFTDAQFLRGAQFNGSRWEGETGFHMTSFHMGADFANVLFVGPVTMSQTHFGPHTRFTAAQFFSTADFSRASSDDPISFESADFLGPLVMFRCRWSGGVMFPSTVIESDHVDFRETLFGRYLQVTITSPDIDLHNASISAGGQIHLGAGSRITLEDADILSPLIVASTQLSDGQAAPEVRSIRRTNAAQLSFEGVSLRHCLFFGAVNLDKLRTGGGVALGRSPRGRLRHTRREVVYEEVLFRANGRGGSGWLDPSVTVPPDSAIGPAQISGVYRALRKGREDAKDEPGASDLYYGEMEMRRLATSRSSFERFLLWIYWFTSGYALRASRAFGMLALSLTVFATCYALFGFAGSTLTTFRVDWVGRTPVLVEGSRAILDAGGFMEQFRNGLLLSLQTGLSLVRAPSDTLTGAGSVVELINRIVAPILVGLGVLSLRSRVKR